MIGAYYTVRSHADFSVTITNILQGQNYNSQSSDTESKAQKDLKDLPSLGVDLPQTLVFLAPLWMHMQCPTLHITSHSLQKVY